MKGLMKDSIAFMVTIMVIGIIMLISEIILITFIWSSFGWIVGIVSIIAFLGANKVISPLIVRILTMNFIHNQKAKFKSDKF